MALDDIFELTLQAREHKEGRQYVEAVKCLWEAAKRRSDVFLASDYQATAAYEHCIWAAIHLGVVDAEHIEDETQSCQTPTLYAMALDMLRTAKGSAVPQSTTASKKERDAGNPHEVVLRPMVRSTLLVALHHNWANYFAHRRKWHAAQQQTAAAEASMTQLLHRKAGKAEEGGKDATAPPPPSPQALELSVLLRVRRCVATVKAGGKGVDLGRKELLTIIAAEDQKKSRDTSHPIDDSSSRPNEEEEGDPTATATASPDGGSPFVVLELSEGSEARELTFCLAAAKPNYSWNGSVSSLTLFLAVYGVTLADHNRGFYTAALQSIQRAAPTGNPSWQDAVILLERLCLTKEESGGVSSHMLPRSATRSTEGLATQRVLRQYLTSERTRKKRLQVEQQRKKAVADEGVEEDEDPAVTEARWRVPPSEEETSGLLVREAQQSAAVRTWTKLLPLLSHRVPAKTALKELGCAEDDLDVTLPTPLEAARATLQVHTADRSKRKSHAESQQQVSVSAEAGQANDPSRRTSFALPTYKDGEASTNTSKKKASMVAKQSVSEPSPNLLRAASVFGAPLDPTSGRVRTPSGDSRTAVTRGGISPTSNGRRSPPPTLKELHEVLDDAGIELVTTEFNERLSQMSNAVEARAKSFRELAAWALQMAEEDEALSVELRKLDAVESATQQAYEAAVNQSFARSANAVSNQNDAPEGGGEIGREMIEPSDRRGASPTSHDRRVSPVASPVKGRVSPTRVTTAAALAEKQASLRYLLPSLDAKSTAYRMVVNEMSENERILQELRKADAIKQLQRSAARGLASRENSRKSVSESGKQLLVARDRSQSHSNAEDVFPSPTDLLTIFCALVACGLSRTHDKEEGGYCRRGTQ